MIGDFNGSLNFIYSGSDNEELLCIPSLLFSVNLVSVEK